ncbi:ABC transporter permease [Microscilla marina]|uniref:Releasing system transmembrane protein n=1 Tax=Microscilla marina ATCC 23134 TaxID=313606 RepID=A1ZSJ6_MICM2|nr:FtsX-like permease family protein [Microscilla marina]EAY26576.1 releasing system transmembrane protein [Microscilla marina ATCC 23134]
MNLPLFIARRYFFSKHKKQFINVISILSMIEVAVGTIALILVLSVFNGLQELIQGLHDTFNPELKVEPIKGKSFEVSSQLIKKIEAVPGVKIVSEIIEDNAVLRYKNGQMVVKVKGVSENYLEQTRMDSAIRKGEFALYKNGRPRAVIGQGVQYTLAIGLRNDFDALQLWYPKKVKKITLGINAEKKLINKKAIFPIGVFSLEQQYDASYVFVPLKFAANLLQYDNRRTSLEIQLKEKADTDATKKGIKEVLGNNFKVLDRNEQQANLLKAIQIEKLFVYITLSFILLVASINIFFSLMMLMIDKKKDVAVLLSMGASTKIIRKIFMMEGGIIAFSGAIIGLLVATTLAILQQKYGFIGMGTSTTVVEAYPVKLKSIDFIFTCITIVLITFLAAYYPARKASQIDVRENLT